MQGSARAKQAGQSKQTSERCKRPSKWTSEWPSTSVRIPGYSDPQWRHGSEDDSIERESDAGLFFPRNEDKSS